MAARPWRLVAVSLTLAITMWLWALDGFLLALRWNSIERPQPPKPPLFPYGEMRIGVDASYPPFAVATGDDLFGLDIDLGRALGQQLNIPVRFVNMGYDGLYDSLRADQVDVVISALLVDPARMGDVRYTQAYYNAGLVLVTGANSPLASMSDLSGHSLAFEFGSDSDLEARRWLRRTLPFDQRPYELADYALDAVRLNRADAALVDATTAKLYQRAHPDWQAQVHQVTDIWYAAAVRIDRGATWQAINNALQRLIDDGSLPDIIDRWL